jgi:hypothetical protein
LISKYVVLLAALLAAAGTIEAKLKSRNYRGVFLILGVLIACFGLFAWIFE